MVLLNQSRIGNRSLWNKLIKTGKDNKANPYSLTSEELTMLKFSELIKSPHIQLSLTAGFSIIAMAYVSKRVLTEPIGYLFMAIPPFLIVIYEVLVDRYKNSKVCTTWYWVTAILIATFVVIVSNMF